MGSSVPPEVPVFFSRESTQDSSVLTSAAAATTAACPLLQCFSASVLSYPARTLWVGHCDKAHLFPPHRVACFAGLHPTSLCGCRHGGSPHNPLVFSTWSAIPAPGKSTQELPDFHFFHHAFEINPNAAWSTPPNNSSAIYVQIIPPQK